MCVRACDYGRTLYKNSTADKMSTWMLTSQPKTPHCLVQLRKNMNAFHWYLVSGGWYPVRRAGQGQSPPRQEYKYLYIEPPAWSPRTKAFSNSSRLLGRPQYTAIMSFKAKCRCSEEGYAGLKFRTSPHNVNPDFTR